MEEAVIVELYDAQTMITSIGPHVGFNESTGHNYCVYKSGKKDIYVYKDLSVVEVENIKFIRTENGLELTITWETHNTDVLFYRGSYTIWI